VGIVPIVPAGQLQQFRPHQLNIHIYYTLFVVNIIIRPFSTHVFRRRWRKFSPPKNFLCCSFAPSTKGQTEVENFKQLLQENKFLQRRMNVKK
jgi:hypothetical protein